MLINYSHHPSDRWDEKQTAAAKEYGEIIDVPFAYIPPKATTQEVINIAKEQVDIMLSKNPEAVLCQGEMTVCFHIVSLLKQKGVKVLCACTERVSEEIIENGKSVTRSLFEFVQFQNIRN